MKDRLLTASFYGLVVVATALFILRAMAPLPAHAAEYPKPDQAVCKTLAALEADLTEAHEKFIELDSESLLGVKGVGLGKIIVTTMGGDLVVGSERDGCMFGPIGIANVVPGTGV